MFAKKTVNVPAPPRTYRKELEYLYARRQAVDALIETLQEYNRFRGFRGESPKRKTA